MARTCFSALALLLVASVAPAAPSAASEAALLRFKVTERPLTYALKSTERVVKEDWDKKGRSWENRFERRLEESVARDEAGGLVRRVKQLKGRWFYQGKPAQDAAATAETVEPIDELGGQRTAEGGLAPEPERMRLVLPREPVLPGATWTYVAPAGQRFPAPLTTRFVLQGYAEVQGRRCAVITSKAQLSGRFRDRNVDAELVSHGRIHFDPSQGLVVTAVSSTTFTLTLLKDVKDGSPRVDRRSFEHRYRLVR